MFRQNTNIEIRNSKQIRIPNDKMIETNPLKINVFVIGTFLISVIVSYFEIRISSF